MNISKSGSSLLPQAAQSSNSKIPYTLLPNGDTRAASQRSLPRTCTSGNKSAPISQKAVQLTALGQTHPTPPSWKASDRLGGADLSSHCYLLCKTSFLKQEIPRGEQCCFRKDVLTPAEGSGGCSEPRGSPHPRNAGANTIPLGMYLWSGDWIVPFWGQISPSAKLGGSIRLGLQAQMLAGTKLMIETSRTIHLRHAALSASFPSSNGTIEAKRKTPRVKENGNGHLVSVQGTKRDCDPLPVLRGSSEVPILCLPGQQTLSIASPCHVDKQA